jgi:hypothetical protein
MLSHQAEGCMGTARRNWNTGMHHEDMPGKSLCERTSGTNALEPFFAGKPPEISSKTDHKTEKHSWGSQLWFHGRHQHHGKTGNVTTPEAVANQPGAKEYQAK